MRIPAAIILAALAAGAIGCVEREMQITSDPPGALVVVSDVEKGRTPVTIPFTWYGDYDIILRLEGHETLVTHALITPPWYEWPPIDLLSATAPWTYRDKRYLHYTLKPLVLPSDDELIRHADEMQKRNQQPVKK